MVHIHTEKCTSKLAVDCASSQASLQPLDRSTAPRFKQTGLALGSEMSGIKRKCGHEAVKFPLPIKLKAFIIKWSKMHKKPKPISDSVEALLCNTDTEGHTSVSGWFETVKIVGKEYTVLQRQSNV